jgi:hypothetical protein
MHTRVSLIAFVAAAAVLTASCSDRPTAPKATSAERGSLSPQRGPAGPAAERAALLTNIPVAGALLDGGSFTGTITAKSISIDPVTRVLTMTGVVNGTALKSTGEAVEVVDQAFTVPVSLNRPGATSSLVQPAAQASCGILDLVLGPLHLDLLGLVVDLNQVVLDITAMTGAGNLLGNLLCALTGLLDIPGAIASITHIVDMVNNILSGLTVPGVGGVMWIAPRAAFSQFTT